MRRNIIHIVLFVLTVASTLLTTQSTLLGGVLYSISIMLILLGHEMGHYFMSRRYGTKASLPFFLPAPFTLFGTLGAIIRMESTIPSRKALFDTGAAGPLISLSFSIPAIVIGLRLSDVIPTSEIKGATIRLADPLLFSLIHRLVMGEVPAGYDILLHPVAFAGWVGLFVTALNLLPVGQLDGGHIAYALFGRKSRFVFLIAIAVMAYITIFHYPGWILLLILIILFGFRHPAPLDDETPLDGKRKFIGGIIFIAFLLSFTPAPLPQFVDEFKQALHWF